MTEPQQQPQSSDDSSGESRHVAAQPQYGQRIEPEYGARADEFPPNYNPYVYGGQPEQPAPQAQPSPSQPASVFGAGPAPAQGGSAPNAAPAQGGPDQGGPRREPPRYFNGIDLNDPQQNPIYGHWDFYAIFSFIFALVSSFPVLPALIGCLAIWRTRRFHTRGRGLAIAAVVINVLTTIIVIWMTMMAYRWTTCTRPCSTCWRPAWAEAGRGTPFRCDGPCAATRKPMNEYMQCTA